MEGLDETWKSEMVEKVEAWWEVRGAGGFFFEVQIRRS